MEIRYKYILAVTTLLSSCAGNEKINADTDHSKKNNTSNCPFAKIVEDIFNIRNKSSENKVYAKDTERAKLLLHSIANVTSLNESKSQEELVNNIIASINRIKNDINEVSKNETKLNEAIIIDTSRDHNRDKIPLSIGPKIVSGVEEKLDTANEHTIVKKTTNPKKKPPSTTTEKTKYMEVLTIEPNNTHVLNTTSNNIIEVLKHLMPMFNNSLNKKLHNITIIERNYEKNHSFTATRNVSTIVVTYCDKENLTKPNFANLESDEIPQYDEYEEDEDIEGDGEAMNMTVGEKRDIMEAAEYGMRKMHELYSVLEPKLYSMGLWLDDTNPARYVAAFNAPSEDAAKFSRYGYATLQAATRLKQLTNENGGVEGRTEETQFPAASALRQSPLMQHCPLRGAPKCPPASKRYRTHDGTCNNLHRPRWGSTMTPVQRFIPPSYSDDLQAPRRSITGMRLPSAREISSLVHQSENVENLGITHLLMQWGQFLDHDVTSSSQSRGFNGSVPRCCKDGGRDFIPREFMHPECFPIPVPLTDPFYGPRGIRCLDFIRSSPAPRDDCALGWREQMNQVSAYIDGSPLYGSSARQSDNLRLFRNGMLQYGRVQQRRPLLPPERKDELCRGGAVSTDCFKSGDARVNEHPGLVAAHIVWLRQHNRMAQELAHLNPHWSDEKIYQETRKIVGAMIQHITYREFLPIVLGSEVIRLFDLDLLVKGYYKEYNPKINPSPASSFGSAAFRFGHSLVQSSMVRFDSFHRPMSNNVSLHDELTNPSNIWSIGAVDRLLLGLVNQPIQHRDEFITDELTNHLFQTPQIDFGMDLAAINIQRGRDHGVPSYTTWREPCGLSVIQDFEDLFRVMPERAVRKMQLLYRHVDDIDLFTGGMAERPVVGGLVGPTFACIIAQQFSNLRTGDRFWYENGGFDSSFTPAQLQQIRRISFAQVLCHTLDTIDTIQPFVFLSPANPDNDRISCQNGLLNNFDLSPWIEIDSDSNNIRTADDDSPTTSTEKLKRTKPTTTTKRPNTTTKRPNTTTKRPNTTSKRPNTTKKPQKGVNKDAPIIRAPSKTNSTKTSDKSLIQNQTNHTDITNDNTTLTDKHVTKSNKTVQIDDKLDFKNKSRRYDDPDIINSRQNRPTKYDDYDYDDDNTQSIQSVVINNVHHKRPYNRPVITVTENTNKYTYLINYVPRPTESWRQTTKKTYDRDVVKVTYQTYDDTYRRPNKPYYYNKRDNNENDNERPYNRQTTEKDLIYYSARSNDATDKTTTKSKITDKSNIFSSTTDSNLYKLVTFGYVGSYKGQTNDKTNDKITLKDETEPKVSDLKLDTTTDLTTDKTEIYKKRQEPINKVSSIDGVNTNVKNEDGNNMKLSTFYLYETATKPYPLHRPTRRNDDEIVPNYSKNNVKYYYVRNVLHKYSDNKTKTADSETNVKSGVKLPSHKAKVPHINIEERSSVNKLAALDDIETKPQNTNSQRIKTRKPVSSTKTPSIAFQVIPSESSPTLWAVYEENADLPEILPHKMPMVKTDPQALKEVPRPIRLSGLRRRQPGRF